MGATIRIQAADGHRLSAYRAGPEAPERALVVVQEIFGVNAHMRRVCDAFAAEGYGVVAPALFDRIRPGVELGYGPQDVSAGRNLRGQVSEQAVMHDIEAAAALMRGASLGVVGYCWGGTVAWWGSTRSHSFKAAVAWYGGGIAVARAEHLNCPVQLHFGETDSSIPLSDVDAIRDAQPGVEVFVYPGVGHGFGCEERESFNPEAAALAQRRTLAFFAGLV